MSDVPSLHQPLHERIVRYPGSGTITPTCHIVVAVDLRVRCFDLLPASRASTHAIDQCVCCDAQRREERLQCGQIDREMDRVQDGVAPLLRHSNALEKRFEVLPVVCLVHQPTSLRSRP
jgi:hypothetical protein